MSKPYPTSVTFGNIERALSAPNGKLVYLKEGERYQINDFYEFYEDVIVVKTHLKNEGSVHAGHLVTKFAFENFRPRRYIKG